MFPKHLPKALFRMLCCFYLVRSGLKFRLLLWMALSTAFMHVDWNLWRGGDSLSLSVSSLFPLAEALTCSRSRCLGWRHPRCHYCTPSPAQLRQKVVTIFSLLPSTLVPTMHQGPSSLQDPPASGPESGRTAAVALSLHCAPWCRRGSQ